MSKTYTLAPKTTVTIFQKLSSRSGSDTIHLKEVKTVMFSKTPQITINLEQNQSAIIILYKDFDLTVNKDGKITNLDIYV